MLSWDTDGGELPTYGNDIVTTTSGSGSGSTTGINITDSSSESFSESGSINIRDASYFSTSIGSAVSSQGGTSGTSRASFFSSSGSGSGSTYTEPFVGGTTEYTSISSSSFSTKSGTSITTAHSSGSTFFSSTESYDSYSGSAVTTTETTTARTFTHFSLDTVTRSVHTTDTSSNTTKSQVDTFLTTTSSELVDWPVSSFTDTLTTLIHTSTTNVETWATTTTDTPIPPFHISATELMAESCSILYTAGNDASYDSFCSAFASIDGHLTFTPLYETSSTSFSFEGYSETDFFYVETELTQHDAPVLYGTNQCAVYVPRAMPGYQPYSALSLSDNIYSSYSIHLPSSVSGTSSTKRAKGSTIARHDVTQVFTLNREDTLEMLTSLSSSSVSALAGAYRGGGYGDAGVDQLNTVKLWPGSWRFTSYDSITSGTGEVMVVTSTSSSFVESRGRVYALEHVPVYIATAAWLTPQKTALVELPCQE